jgi:hypothetical protein
MQIELTRPRSRYFRLEKGGMWLHTEMSGKSPAESRIFYVSRLTVGAANNGLSPVVAGFQDEARDFSMFRPHSELVIVQ